MIFMIFGKKVDGVLERFYKTELEFNREVILGFEKVKQFEKMKEVIKRGLEFDREKRFENVGERVEKLKEIFV